MTTSTNIKTSTSALGQADQCLRAWHLGQYLGLELKDQPFTGPLPFGSRIHKALEIAEKQKRWPDIERVWNELMDDAYSKTIFTKELSTEAKLGSIMLRGFVDWLESTGDMARWEVVGVESQFGKYIKVPLGNGEVAEVLFRGKMDVIERDLVTGMLWVKDFKTTKSVMDEALIQMELNPQGPNYVWLLQENTPDVPVAGVSYLLLRKVQQSATAKPPFYHRLEVPVTPSRLRAAKRNMIAKVERIAEITRRLDAGEQADRVAPYTTGWWCKSCPFRQPCMQMIKGNPKGGNAMLEELYVAGDPMKRYLEGDDAEIEAR